MILTDLDFAEDIAFISDGMVQVQELLSREVTECAKVGLRLNLKKTQYMTFNFPDEPLKTIGYVELRQLDKYLGSWIKASNTDFKVRKVWKVLNQMKNVWF